MPHVVSFDSFEILGFDVYTQRRQFFIWGNADPGSGVLYCTVL
jgi:hypothetical protein